LASGRPRLSVKGKSTSLPPACWWKSKVFTFLKAVVKISTFTVAVPG
jgi:hypothetical protein